MPNNDQEVQDTQAPDYAALAKQFGGTVAAAQPAPIPVPTPKTAPPDPNAPVAKAPAGSASKLTADANYGDLVKQYGGTIVSPSSIQSAAPEESWEHKLVAGPNTALGEAEPASFKQEREGLADIFHGDISGGAGKIWESEAIHVTPGSPLEKLIQKVNPNFHGAGGPEGAQAQKFGAAPQLGDKPLGDAAQFIDKKKSPMIKALAETAQSFLSPQTISMMAATGGAGMVDSPAALGMGSRLISAGFAGQTIANAYQHLKAFKEAYDKGDTTEALYQITHAVASGAMTALTAQHAATGESPTENAWTKAGAKADAAVGTAITKTAAGLANKAADLIPNKAPETTPAEHLEAAADNLYKAIKPGKKMVADEFRQTLDDAMPQLSVIANKNPEVQTPVDMAKAIEQHRVGIEAQLKQKAADMRGLPQARMDGVEAAVQAAMDEGFNKAERKYTPDEIEKAQASVMKMLGLETGKMETDPDTGEKVLRVNRIAPTPDIYGAENIRQRFNDDTAAAYRAGPGNVPSAEVYAKMVAGKALRDAIDEKFEENGVEGVKEWRKQEVPLIDVRDALMNAAKRSEDAGQWSLWKSILKTKGWGSMPAIVGAVAGGVPGAVIGELAHLGMDWVKDQQENPNVLTSKALDRLQKAGPSDEAAIPGKTTPTVGNPPLKTEAPEAEKEGSFAGALREGSKAANSPEWVRGEFDHEIQRLEGITRDPNATAEEKSIAKQMLDHTREMSERITNPNQGAAEVTPASQSTEVNIPKIQFQTEETTPIDYEAGENKPYGAFSVNLPEDQGHALVGLNGDGIAQINDSGIASELRGKGIGRQLYTEAINQAKQRGALIIRSDSAVSPDAARVWESLKRDYPVTEFEGPTGKRFQIDLNAPKPTDNVGVSKLHFAADKAGLEYKGSLESGKGDIFHTFDDPVKPGDQITIKESELPEKGLADFLKQKMAEKRESSVGGGKSIEDLRQELLNNVKQSQIKTEYPKAGNVVDGLKVRDTVPNMDSIDATFERSKVLPGIREIPLNEFDAPPEVNTRTKNLAAQIKESGEINPLIVAVDKNGPYILEGGHRYDALKINGAKSFPAIVVLDTDSLGSVGQPQAKLLEAPIPKGAIERGNTTQSTINHELGHSVVGDAVGMIPGEIRSHLHPWTIADKAIAQAGMDYTPVGGEGGRITHEQAKPIFVDKFVPMFYAGGVAQELLDGIPVAENTGMYGDIAAIKSAMRAMKFSEDEIDLARQLGEAQARKILTKSGILDIIKKYSATREENLPNTLHMSAERVHQMLKEIKDLGDKNVESKEASGQLREGIQNLDSRTTGTVPSGNGSGDEIKAPELKTRKSDLPLAAGIGATALGGLGALSQPSEPEKKESKPLSYEELAKKYGGTIGEAKPAVKTAVSRKEIPDLLDKAAEDYNLPIDLLRAQAQQESRMNQDAVSPKGAKGVMQLMPQTAKDLGVDADDVEDNIKGGAKLMAQLRERYNGDNEKALAAYNWSPDKVDAAIKKYGANWKSGLPHETKHYIKAIMAQQEK